MASGSKHSTAKFLQSLERSPLNDVVTAEGYPVFECSGDGDLGPMFEHLLAKGWAFVNLPEDITTGAAAVIDGARDLFTSESDEVKESYALHPRYGYQKTAHKEAFRALTGDLIAKTPLPPHLEGVLPDFAAAVDALSTTIGNELVDLLSTTVTTEEGDTKTTPYSHTCELLESSRRRTFTNRNEVDLGMFGMFDVVRYAGGDGAIEGEEHVSLHVDPGLFSISFGSSAPGLQLVDHVKKAMVEVPIDQPVVWLGSAAADGPGVTSVGWHCVAKHGDCSEDRYTAWYEACDASQIPKMFRFEGYPVSQEKWAAIKAQCKHEDGFPVFVRTLTGKQLRIEAHPDMSVLEVLLILQDREGLPPEKNRMIHAGKVMEQGHVISEYGIEAYSVLHLVLSLRGGEGVN